MKTQSKSAKAEKTLSRNNKLLIAGIITVLLLVVTGVSIGVTFAIWEQAADTTKEVPLDIEKYNPSEQYIIFVGLNSSGAFADSPSAITSYAVVGYTGLVAELKIPAMHEEKPVTHILQHPDYIEDRLQNNPIITKMTIPSSVTRIGAGVCSQMSELAEVVFEAGGSNINIEDMAFAGCGNLNRFVSNGRTVVGNAYSYLMGTKCI